MKAGFKKDKHDNYCLHISMLASCDIWNLNLVTCDNLDDNGNVTILTIQLQTNSTEEKVTEWPWIHLDNTNLVHHLQNLYLDLTGEELPIS